MDLWIVGVALVGISGILRRVNFIVTIYGRRAPGMHMFRMPHVHLDDPRDVHR